MKNELLHRMRLGQLVTLQSLLVIAATLLIGFGSVYSALGSWMKQNAQTQNQEFAEAVGDDLDALSTEMEEFLTNEAKILEALGQDAPRETLEKEISALTRLNSFFGAAVLLDTKEAPLMAVSSDMLPSGRWPQDSLQQIVATCTPGPIKPVLESIAGEPVLLFAHPLKRFSQEPGRCIIGIMPTGVGTPFAERLRRHLPRGDLQAYVTNADGQVLFRYSQNTAAPPVSSGETGGAQPLRQNSALEPFEQNRGQFIEGRATAPDLGWEVVVQHLKGPLLASRLAWFKHAFLISLLPFVLMLLVSTHFLRKVSRPLAELANVIGAVEEKPESGANHDHYASTARRIREIHCWYREVCLIKDTLLKRIDTVHGKIRDLYETAQLDELTQLGNRRALTSTLRKLASATLPFGIIALDIDFFKRINDHYGHATGDAVLQAVAEKLRDQLRAGDQAFRSGGEEFIVLLPGADEIIAQGVAYRINRGIYESSILDGQRITLSAGVTVWTQGSTASALEAADGALYLAKSRGRNRVAVHSFCPTTPYPPA